MDVKEDAFDDVDLTREETIAFLKDCEMEVEYIPEKKKGENGCNWSFPAWTEPKVKYKGDWMDLGRTGSCDNVATGLCENWDVDAWRSHYLKKAEKCIGTRINRCEKP